MSVDEILMMETSSCCVIQHPWVDMTRSLAEARYPYRDDLIAMLQHIAIANASKDSIANNNLEHIYEGQEAALIRPATIQQ
jgi:hypothetical protein